MKIFIFTSWILTFGVMCLNILMTSATDCPPGKYGSPNCTNTCPDFCQNKLCHENGNCVTCNSGYRGPSCNEVCPQPLYGQNCSQSCSTQCLSRTCNSINGNCIGGCINGYQGVRCDKVCNTGFYGPNCNTSCPSLCSNNTCNHDTGNCLTCQSGYVGSKCEVTCPTNTFGDNCEYNCSQHCIHLKSSGTKCHHDTGACLLGCDEGFEGYQCNNKIDTDKFTLNTALLINLLFGFIILFVVLAALAWCYIVNQRRRRRRQMSISTDGNLYNKMSFTRKSESAYAIFDTRGIENGDIHDEDKKETKDNHDEAMDTDSVYMNTEQGLKASVHEQVTTTNDIEEINEEEKQSHDVDDTIYANVPVAGKDHS